MSTLDVACPSTRFCQDGIVLMERIMATAAVIAVACAVSAVTLAMQASPVAALKATTDLASGKL